MTGNFYTSAIARPKGPWPAIVECQQWMAASRHGPVGLAAKGTLVAMTDGAAVERTGSERPHHG